MEGMWYIYSMAKESIHFLNACILLIFSLLRSEILRDLLLFTTDQSGIIKLLIETLDLRHYRYMPVLHVSHVQQNGKQYFTLKLYLKFRVLF